MSTATLHQPLPLHVPIPVSSISPRLLHSPDSSPETELQQYLANYPMNTYTTYPSTSQQPASITYSLPTTSQTTPLAMSSSASECVISQGGMVTIHSYMPSTGQRGTCITTYIDFSSNVQGPIRLRLVFGDVPRPTIVDANSDRSYTQTQGDWTLKAYVPSIDEVSAHMAKMSADHRLEWPLTIQALDSDSNVLDSVTFGAFCYDNYSDTPSPSSPPSTYDYPSLPAKRLHDEMEYSSTMPVKRAAVDDETIDFRRLSFACDSQTQPASNPSSRTRPSYQSPYMTVPSSRTGTTMSPQRLTQAMSLPSSSLSQQSFFATGGKRKRSRSSVVANTSAMASLPETKTSLIRTSQLGNQAAEPAVIVFRDNLETMKHSWTEDELKAHRRLVKFWKRQSGNKLEISFAAIPQSSYKENTIVVSCIYREDIDDFFITSVDVIYLLESLSGSRFEVEEKNRIRRNLEGFKPLTVSKCKPGTEDFFRVIMEFAAPRPRNIEKDVKVFEWRKLKDMVDKVFSKYSTIPIGHLSSSRSMDTTETSILQQQSDSEDTKKPIIGARRRSDSSNNNGVSVDHQSATGTAATQKQEVTYPQVSMDQMKKMNENAGDFYGGVHVYDSPNMPPGGEGATPVVKTEYPSYSPFSLLNSHNNGDLGKAYEQSRTKSPPSSDNSPLSATMSISSAGSTGSDNGIVGEVADYLAPFVA